MASFCETKCQEVCLIRAVMTVDSNDQLLPEAFALFSDCREKSQGENPPTQSPAASLPEADLAKQIEDFLGDMLGSEATIHPRLIEILKWIDVPQVLPLAGIVDPAETQFFFQAFNIRLEYDLELKGVDKYEYVERVKNLDYAKDMQIASIYDEKVNTTRIDRLLGAIKRIIDWYEGKAEVEKGAANAVRFPQLSRPQPKEVRPRITNLAQITPDLEGEIISYFASGKKSFSEGVTDFNINEKVLRIFKDKHDLKMRHGNSGRHR